MANESITTVAAEKRGFTAGFLEFHDVPSVRAIIMKSYITEPESLRKKGKEKRLVMRVRDCIRAPIGNTDVSENRARD